MGDPFKVLKPLETGAVYFFERSKVIQSNIANADTPFYKPKDLVFERELESGLALKRTDPKHIDPAGERKVGFKEVEVNDVSGYDANKVDLDKELGKLAETAIMVRAINEAIRKEIGKLKLSISGR